MTPSVGIRSNLIYINALILFLWYSGSPLPCSADSSGFMSSLLDDFFKAEEFFSATQKPLKSRPTIPTPQEGQDEADLDDGTDRPHRRRAIRRRVIKVLASTEEEEFDCNQRGGTPCNRDSECCLGKCSPFNKCPTASELFDAAAIILKKEKEKKARDKRIAKKGKSSTRN